MPQSVQTVSVPPYCGVLAAVVDVVVVVVVDLQELTNSELGTKTANISKLTANNRIFFFTSFSPFF
jgi:hypothetical protein